MSKRKEFVEKVLGVLDRHMGDPCRIYLCSADFADFKMINYTYGFAHGDELLNRTVQFVRSVPGCVLCERAGMDQFFFVIVTEKMLTETEVVAAHNERIEEFLSAEQERSPASHLKIWCGIYELRDRNVEAAIEKAALARREAKVTGEESTVLFKESILDKLVEQKKQEKEIEQALNEGRFTFYLQPQVDLTTGEIIGAEALARGFHSDGTMLSPAVFIPVFEKNGRILELDYFILEQVCRNIRARMDAGMPVIQISVNLSRLHLNRQDTAERIHAIAEKYQVPPKLLKFELTENIFLHEFAGAKSLGARLRSFGYVISVDDFGSGYAGIDILRNLSFDELKLDRSFLTEDEDSKRRNGIIISGLVGIAHNLGISVVCEGVETSQQCRSQLDADCRLAQGFYFSKPLPAEDFYSRYQEMQGRYPLDYM